MYIAHPTHGAGTRPKRTQLTTAARKTTLNAGQCVRKLREGRGRNRQTPPQKKQQRGEGGGRENSPQPPRRPPTPPEAAKPPPEGTEDRTPKEAQGDHPAKTGNTKPGTAAHREKGHRNKQTHTTKKKASNPARKKGDGGTGTTRPGTGTPSKKQKKAQKTHPDNPAKKGWAQPRPGPSTHAHTARQNRKRRGASGAPTQPHTSHKQAETEPQP